MNSFVSSHLHTVAFTHATSFPLKLSPGFPVMHFSNDLSASVLMTVLTIICCLKATLNCSISVAAAIIVGSSPLDAKLVSEEVKPETSSVVKSLDSWGFESSAELRDQKGIFVFLNDADALSEVLELRAWFEVVGRRWGKK